MQLKKYYKPGIKDRTIDKKPTESCTQRCTAMDIDFLERNFKDCLKHDWLEDGHTFPLMQYYIDLVWTRMVKEALGWGEKSMKGMDEILEIPGAGRKGLNVLIQGK